MVSCISTRRKKNGTQNGKRTHSTTTAKTTQKLYLIEETEKKNALGFQTFQFVMINDDDYIFVPRIYVAFSSLSIAYLLDHFQAVCFDNDKYNGRIYHFKRAKLMFHSTLVELILSM